MIRRPPRSTQSRSSAASDVYKRQPSPPRARTHFVAEVAAVAAQVVAQVVTDADATQVLVTIHPPQGRLRHVAALRRDGSGSCQPFGVPLRLPGLLHIGLDRSHISRELLRIGQRPHVQLEVTSLHLTLVQRCEERRVQARARRDEPSHVCYLSLSSGSSSRTARKASCGTSMVPICFMRFLPFFCFSSSLRLRLMSPP